MTSFKNSTFDFVVVGSGPAGSAAAAGLAASPTAPSVLLIEAGGSLEDHNLRVDGQRWQTFTKEGMNWGYKTVSQKHCADREIDYSRGKGLGGSSAINFGVFTIGPRDDYEQWADLVDDDAFRWKHVQRRLKALESFNGKLPDGVDKKYAAPKDSNHGSSGPLKTGYSAEWEDDLPPLLDVFEKAGFALNPDHNSGNPLGMSVLINSAHQGVRSTAKDLYAKKPDSLTVLTENYVQRVLIEKSRAVGVESNGKRYYALKEVILCAGALDSPRILMHSGIGPKEQLQRFNIPIIQDTPAVGQGLRDHQFTSVVHKRSSGARESFYGNDSVMNEAMEQWKRDGTGPWAKYACEAGIGFFKLDTVTSASEFHNLPLAEQRYLNAETIPHTEFFTHVPIHWFVPNFPKEDLNYTCLSAFLYNSQARGEVTLQSSDPNVPLLFDPKFLEHPFDRRVAIESLRALLRVASSESYKKGIVAQLFGPASESDEDLLAYWRQTISSAWHMTGTLKMGKQGEVDAVVDSNFRVFGIEGLRVADMSVVPVIANAHVQAVAYITGMTCAEKIVAQLL